MWLVGRLLSRATAIPVVPTAPSAMVRVATAMARPVIFRMVGDSLW